MPVEISVKEMLPDAVPVSAKDVMVLLANVKQTNASVTKRAVLNHNLGLIHIATQLIMSIVLYISCKLYGLKL